MKGARTKKELSQQQREQLLKALKARFDNNMKRHEGAEWNRVKAKLEADAEKLWTLGEMERTGGEPDVVAHDTKEGRIRIFRLFAGKPEKPQKFLLRPRGVNLQERK